MINNTATTIDGGLLRIYGTDHSLRVNVNLNEFESAHAANAFAARLRSILVDRYDYAGDVCVTDCHSGFFAGDEFDGDLPEGWSRDDYEAIWSGSDRVDARGHGGAEPKR